MLPNIRFPDGLRRPFLSGLHFGGAMSLRKDPIYTLEDMPFQIDIPSIESLVSLPNDRPITVEALSYEMLRVKPTHAAGIEGIQEAIARAIETGRLKPLEGRTALKGESFLNALLSPNELVIFLSEMGFGVHLHKPKSEATSSTAANGSIPDAAHPVTARDHFASFNPREPRYDDPAWEIQYIVARDLGINPRMWWGLKSVAAKKAAMLLCGLNPHDPSASGESLVGGDEPNAEAYRAILETFEDEATDGTPRSLRSWLNLADERHLKHHSWIDEWISHGGNLGNV
ncbi:hypothetical protein J2W28_007000 [Variovorax boronicumulans]|uniref:hypothetical protein n=1 Tax=Variovorax boronicumulans TaxID=436515 RepID=UPI00278B639E|nr:hypothetical protein [Variovorax boronicumulans]MDP9996509.1 hypothetical protein [Variovorax boronicumulans]MDQ0007816.1 hypothetical protein [Variovorax boronicumulans]